LLCAATGHVTECTGLKQLLGDDLILPTSEALNRLPTAPVRLALTATSDLPSIADLLGPEPVRVRVPRHDEQDVPVRRKVPREANPTEAADLLQSDARLDVPLPQDPIPDSFAASETEGREGRTTGTELSSVAGDPEVFAEILDGSTTPAPAGWTPRLGGVHSPPGPAVSASAADETQGNLHRGTGAAIAEDGDESVESGGVGACGSIRGGNRTGAGEAGSRSGGGGGGGGYSGAPRGGGRSGASSGILATEQVFRTLGSAPSAPSTFGRA
jgi:hypothetical protein